MVCQISKRWRSSLNSKRLSTISSMSNKTILYPRACSSCPRRRACSRTLWQFEWSKSAVRKSSKKTIKSSSRSFKMFTSSTVLGSTFCFYQTCQSKLLTSTTVWQTRVNNLRKKCLPRKDKKKHKQMMLKELKVHLKQTNRLSMTGWYLQD